MTGNHIARSYARALLAVGNKLGPDGAENCKKDLTQLTDAVMLSPKLAKVFKNPTISKNEKVGVVKALAEELGVSPTMRNFAHLLAEKGRFDQLAAIAEVYTKLLDTQSGLIRGKMRTAFWLSREKKAEVVAQLEQQTGRKIVLDFEVSPEIIGGVVLEIGDDILDASLRAQLSILKDTIKRGE